MSQLNGSDTGIPNRSKKTYLAVATATTGFYSYSVALNSSYVNVGTLTGSAATVVKGTLLRENGKKLFPEANPGVSKYLVGVYLSESPFTSGFIDPNSGLFVEYNSDKPTYLGGSSEFVLTTPTIPEMTTNGTVVAGTGVVATTGTIKSTTITALSGATPTIDVSLGQVFTVAKAGGVNTTLSISNPQAGATVFLIITSDATAPGAGSLAEVTFGTNILGRGVLTTAASKVYTIKFVCDGTNLYELGRTAAQTDTT
jgi:hypothetical protein